MKRYKFNVVIKKAPDMDTAYIEILFDVKAEYESKYTQHLTANHTRAVS